MGHTSVKQLQTVSDGVNSVAETAARPGVTYGNTSENEPLVILRYFGPEVNPDAPAIGGA